MSLTTEIDGGRNDTEMSVFGEYVYPLMSIQHQLHDGYHTDRPLHHRLINSVYIPFITDLLRDRPPRTSHQLFDRVPDQKQRTAEAESVHIPDRDYDPEEKNDEEATYNLGERYGGPASTT